MAVCTGGVIASIQMMQRDDEERRRRVRAKQIDPEQPISEVFPTYWDFDKKDFEQNKALYLNPDKGDTFELLDNEVVRVKYVKA